MNKKWWRMGLMMLGLLSLTEFSFRSLGYRAGYLHAGFNIVDSIINTPSHFLDKDSIWKCLKKNGDTSINDEGFRCPYNFKTSIDSLRKRKQKIIMMVGDSYTEGISTGNYTDSYASLIDEDTSLAVINFGVGGTDPLQYELVIKKYASIIKPDLIVVCFFLGNDIMYAKRTDVTHPLMYETNAGNFLAEPHVYTDEAPKKPFDNASTAYTFVMQKLTLNYKNSSCFQKIVGCSALGTFVYYKWNPPFKQVIDKKAVSDYYLKNCINYCNQLKTPITIVAIQGIRDTRFYSSGKLEQKYNAIFRGLPVSYLYYEEYNGDDYFSESNDHFTKSGNLKCANNILSLLKKFFRTHNYSKTNTTPVAKRLNKLS